MTHAPSISQLPADGELLLGLGAGHLEVAQAPATHAQRVKRRYPAFSSVVGTGHRQGALEPDTRFRPAAFVVPEPYQSASQLEGQFNLPVIPGPGEGRTQVVQVATESSQPLG